MRYKFITAAAIYLNVCLMMPSASAGAGLSDALSLRGYIKEMPVISLDRNFSSPAFNNILHNRLNFRLDATRNFRLFLEGRNRILYNEMFAEIPGVRDIFKNDPGLADMSWVWLSDGSWIGHSQIDRFYVDWSVDNWQVRAGRQRINWGINLVSNPNDLFNTYSFFDFDYPERPGSNALRVQYFTDHLSRLQLAVSPSRDSREMVAAVMVNSNLLNSDWQALAGYYKHRMALGVGWAASVRGAGFKGEATWFYDLEESSGVDRGNIVAAAGFDYMFSRGTFAVLEFLYNGGYGRRQGEVFLITEPLRPDNIMFSRYAVTLSTQHPFSPVVQGGMAVMALPDIDASFLMPSVSFSVLRNFDAEFTGQIFLGGSGTIFEGAGSGWFISLQYSF